MSLLQPGESVLVTYRARYVGDNRGRHLVGVVQASTELAIRVSGALFLQDADHHAFARAEGERTEIVGIGDANVTIAILPRAFQLGSLSYTTTADGTRCLTDGRMRIPLDIRSLNDQGDTRSLKR